MWLVLAAALLGAVFGLLAPLPVYRLATSAEVPSRTACHYCGWRFRPGPVGWLATNFPGWSRTDSAGWFSTRHPRWPAGRCPGCRRRLGPSAALLSTTGAAAFALLAGVLGFDPVLPVFLAVAALGLVLGPVDLACLRLPDPLVAVAASLAGIGLTGVAVAIDSPHRLLSALAGTLVSAATYLLMALLPGSRLGFGDVKLVAVLGLLLGWIGWRAVLLGLALPHLLNGVAVLVLLTAGRVTRHSLLPLGPALLVGALLAVLLS